MAAKKGTNGNNTLLFLALILVIVLIIWFSACNMKCNPEERYGQDPSSRSQAGWIAGPMYGYDPIDHFAEQIASLEAGKPIPVTPRIRGQKSTVRNMSSCGNPNMISPANKIVGPLETYKESHGPHFRTCAFSSDCWEGENCYAGTCIPAGSEPYSTSFKEGYKSEGSCKSCMTTEEFEMQA